MDKIFDYIDAREAEYVTRVMDYVRHPSISAHNIGIRHVAGLLVDMLDGLGFQTQLIETAGHPFVFGEYLVDPSLPTVLLYGHYDVQPPDPLEKWISPPFEPTIRDGRIWARGIGDNKGQHFAQLMGIEALLAVTGTLPCNVKFLLEGEEEIGSPQIADFVAAHREMLACDLVITSDGPLHDTGLPQVTYGVRGMASFELRAKTADRDSHSGNYGGTMPNAVWTLVNLLATMKTPDGEITIAGLHDPIIPATNAERAAVGALPLDVEGFMAELGLKHLDAPANVPFYDRLMFRPTLTINGLHGGYGGEGTKSVIPSEAFAKCDIRLVEAMTPDQVFDCVRAHVAIHAPNVEFIAHGGMLPSKTSLESPYARAITDGIRAARGVEPLHIPSAGGSLPDYVFTKILGVPAFVVPYANHDEANHAPNENLKLDLFHAGIRTGAAMLTKIGGQ
ncbi:M20/M25/M40 family metallo-hydrolase [Ketogulonicigenium vulgare]|uniref:M20/M25/M40 family metallo-hydrolase n=1 Tax=Ketogulonicigenium vulgare TaxID=92945 RepID=UPI002358C66B|nr:M20/M25/M40 family metallo-hydrolase [Ketogulonicigenium vulgare]